MAASPFISSSYSSRVANVNATDPYAVEIRDYDRTASFVKGIFHHYQEESILGTLPQAPRKKWQPQPIPGQSIPTVYARTYTCEAVLMRAVPGRDGRERVRDTHTWPYQTHARILIEFKNSSDVGYGSGVLVGPHHVLTCGHNFDHEYYGEAEAMAVCIAQNQDEYPFEGPFGKEIKVVRVYTFKKWTEQKDSRFDMALLILNQSIGKYSGWNGFLSTDDATLSQEKVHITGYPGDKHAQAKQMWTMEHKFYSIEPELFKYEIDTFKGQSGSAIWMHRYGLPSVLGVHIKWERIDPSDNNSLLINRGVRISQQKFYFLIKAIEETYKIAKPNNSNAHLPNLGRTSSLPPPNTTTGGGRFVQPRHSLIPSRSKYIPPTYSPAPPNPVVQISTPIQPKQSPTKVIPPQASFNPQRTNSQPSDTLPPLFTPEPIPIKSTPKARPFLSKQTSLYSNQPTSLPPGTLPPLFPKESAADDDLFGPLQLVPVKSVPGARPSPPSLPSNMSTSPTAFQGITPVQPKQNLVKAVPLFSSGVMTTSSSSRLPSLSGIVFGKVEWERYFGDIGEEPSLPINIREILARPCPIWSNKKIGETHLLVLNPKTINGQAKSLDYFTGLLRSPKEGHAWDNRYIKNGSEEVLKGSYSDVLTSSYWFFITKEPIPDTLGKKWEAHSQLSLPSYQLPNLFEFLVATALTHVMTGKGLNHETYTRCRFERFRHWGPTYHEDGSVSQGVECWSDTINVGRSASSHLEIVYDANTSNLAPLVGVNGCRELSGQLFTYLAFDE